MACSIDETKFHFCFCSSDDLETLIDKCLKWSENAGQNRQKDENFVFKFHTNGDYVIIQGTESTRTFRLDGCDDCCHDDSNAESQSLLSRCVKIEVSIDDIKEKLDSVLR